jgi:hypothetical protein
MRNIVVPDQGFNPDRLCERALIEVNSQFRNKRHSTLAASDSRPA